MNFEEFKDQFTEDVKQGLADAGIEAKVSTNTVEKINESYEAMTVTPEGSNVGVIEGGFANQPTVDVATFYRIPKALIIESFFDGMSTETKLLYGLLMDRVSLSASSGWIDEQGRVYSIYTINSIMKDLHCSSKKAVRLLRELEKYDLVEKKNRGQGKPTLLYVKNFSTLWSKGKYHGQKENPRVVEREILEESKVQSNNSNKNNNEINNTNSILSGTDDGTMWLKGNSCYSLLPFVTYSYLLLPFVTFQTKIPVLYL